MRKSSRSRSWDESKQKAQETAAQLTNNELNDLLRGLGLGGTKWYLSDHLGLKAFFSFKACLKMFEALTFGVSGASEFYQSKKDQKGNASGGKSW